MISSASFSSQKDVRPDTAENQWSVILNEVRASTTNRLSEKNLLILGDRESGKSTLLNRILGKDSPPSGVGLEHVSVSIKDDERDESTQVNAWILQEDEFASSLLPIAINTDTFSKTIVWIVVNMARPWTIMHSLEKWSRVLLEAIDRIKMDPVTMKQYCEKLEKQFKEYMDPSLAKTQSTSEIQMESLPLAENALSVNLGLQIVVVATKVDHMGVLEKDFDYRDERFDFIQMYIRSWCLRYGAAFVMTSAKENKNIQLLLRYTAYLLYGLKFEEDGTVLDRDSVFVPIGWDNEKKISILYDGLGDIRPTDPFETVIVPPTPVSKQNLADANMQAEDDVEFLKRLQQALQQPIPTRGPESADRRSAAIAASPKKPDGPRGSIGASESSLGAFFNTLLNKNTPKSSPGPARPNPVSSSKLDAGAELERLSKTSPPPSSANQIEKPETPGDL